MQFFRFAIVGGINTLIDFGILNLLMAVTNIYAGFYYALFKAISFFCAVLNSYVLNKRWTFQKKDKFQFQEFLKFILISLIGLTINILTASFVNSLGPQWGLNEVIWANFSALCATGLTLFINFFGYKHLIFR